jgi:hypothetical protein
MLKGMDEVLEVAEVFETQAPAVVAVTEIDSRAEALVAGAVNVVPLASTPVAASCHCTVLIGKLEVAVKLTVDPEQTL